LNEGGTGDVFGNIIMGIWLFVVVIMSIALVGLMILAVFFPNVRLNS